MNTARLVRGALWGLLSLACGGAADEVLPPPASTPAAQPAATPPAADSAATPAAVSQADSTQLQREVFAYRGAGRDPFQSLLSSASLRPLVGDVRLIGLTFDPQYPARSVAVLRDTSQNKRYAVRVGDELGQMRVSEIRSDAVLVTLDEFGVERQVVLPIRRREEPTP